VLHVTQPVDGGVGRWVLLLAAYQLQQGWDPLIACPADGDLAAAAAAAGIRVLPWESVRSPVRGLRTEARRLSRLLSAADPDLVHLHSSKAGLVGRGVLRGRRPTVFQPHGWSFLCGRGPVRAAALRWERLAAPWADRVLCVSERERHDGERAGVDASYSVVHNGVALGEWPVVTGVERADARRELGLAQEAAVVACVGRLGRQKGQDRLLLAWPQVAAQVPGAALVLAGDGPDAAALHLRARRRADVVMLGHRTDVRRIFAAADVVAMPSRWEGLSLAALEAAASGRCLVATDVAGMAELLGPPSADGPVLRAGDEAETVRLLTRALVARLRQPGFAQTEGGAARASAAAHFALPEALARTSELYTQLIGEPAARAVPR